MNTPIRKIGIIQTSPQPGDFSNNLRAIVQGYRDCLDHGAELVITSIYALTGPEPMDLKRRKSFLEQQEEAAMTLAAELHSTDVPLITGFCLETDLSDNPEDDDYWQADDGLLYDEKEEAYSRVEHVMMAPCLIHRGNVHPLIAGSNSTIGNLLCHITLSCEEELPEVMPDLIIHMPTQPWHNLAHEKEKEVFCWEAMNTEVPVVCVHSVGTVNGNLYGGGSAIYLSSGLAGRLPYFEPATITMRLTRPSSPLTSPDMLRMVEKALIQGIRDTVRQNGYYGICVPLDFRNSSLLTWLCIKALGASNVSGYSFCGNEYKGITCHKADADTLVQQAAELLSLEDRTALTQRIRGALLSSFCEEKGLMLLCPLDQHSLMMGEFTLYGESCGYLAPFGNLYRSDIFMLSKYISEQDPDMVHSIPEPTKPEQDRLIHDLMERNVSAGDILRVERGIFEENEVRLVQRKTTASALKRTQLPIILRFTAPDEQLQFPVSHRLND